MIEDRKLSHRKDDCAMRPSEQKMFWVYPHMCHSGGTTATKRGIRRAYRTALLQNLNGRARAILASI